MVFRAVPLLYATSGVHSVFPLRVIYAFHSICIIDPEIFVTPVREDDIYYTYATLP